MLDDMTQAVEGRWGSREIEITGVTLKGRSGEAAHIFQSGERGIDPSGRARP